MEALVLWEVSRKQDYIFSSNKLKENQGASIIIERVIEELPSKIDNRYNDSLIYHGGGGSLYKFSNKEKAKSFIKKISTEIMKEYPGIEIFMVIQEYDDKNSSVAVAVDSAYVKLARKKNERKFSGGQIAFGIERKCESTGLPVSYKDTQGDETRYLSKEIMTKIKFSNESCKKFDELIPSGKAMNDFDDIAKGDKNYMAVVHIDGNQMGKRFEELKKKFDWKSGNHSKKNQEYLNALRKFSDLIKKAYEEAFKHMGQAIEKNANILKDDTCIEEKDKFPIIPIIIAGDDVTYVTNGKIGIETARIFIEYLNKKEAEVYGGKSLNACAGVAIVKSTYPFSKAYELADDLCRNAKKKILEDYNDENVDFSLIDWHIEQGDLMGSISEIREDNYTSSDGNKLYIRPLYLNNYRHWQSYSNLIKAYNNVSRMAIEGKTIARNKLKTLREVLKEGEKATEIYLESNKISYYFPRFEGTIGDYCFNNEGNCMYYGALELLDLYIQLDTKEV